MDPHHRCPHALRPLLLGACLQALASPVALASTRPAQDGGVLAQHGLSARIHDAKGLAFPAEQDAPSDAVDGTGASALTLGTALREVSPGQYLLSLEPSLAYGPRAQPSDLLDVLRTWIEPALASDLELVDWVQDDGALLVIGRPEQQAWVEAFLTRARGFHDLLQIRCRVLSLPHAAVADAGIVIGAEPQILSAAAADALVQRLQAQGADTVTSPALVTQPLQRATISVLSTRRFVVGWVLHHVEPDQRPLADPEVAVVEEGARLQVQVAPLDGGLFGLALDLELNNVVEPVQQQILQLDPGLPPLQVSLLEQRQSSTQARAQLAAGTTLVLLSSDERTEGHTAVLVQLDVVPAEP